MSCSVCCEGNSTVGGVLLFERSGFLSAICTDCWESFSNASPTVRVIKNKAQEAAQQVYNLLMLRSSLKVPNRVKLEWNLNCIIYICQDRKRWRIIGWMWKKSIDIIGFNVIR